MKYSKEKYEELIDKKLSLVKIAKELNVGTTTVRYWLKKFNLKTCNIQHQCMHKHTDDEILEAWKGSSSVNQCLLKLGITNSGGAFYHYKKRLKMLGVETVEGMSDGRKLGGKNTATIRNSEIIIKPKRLRRDTLKKYLNDNSIIECCNKCGITDWNSKKLLLHIHHIDGNCKNNNLDNLEYLCPNCHNIETYAS